MSDIFVPDCEVKTITVCKQCNKKFSWWCDRDKHESIQKYDVPFISPDMKITSFGKWTSMESEKLGRTFYISRSKMAEVVMGPGIQPGGVIPNQWWKLGNVGGERSLIWLGSADGELRP